MWKQAPLALKMGLYLNGHETFDEVRSRHFVFHRLALSDHAKTSLFEHLNLSVFFKVHKNEIRFIWRVGFGALKLNR